MTSRWALEYKDYLLPQLRTMKSTFFYFEIARSALTERKDAERVMVCWLNHRTVVDGL